MNNFIRVICIIFGAILIVLGCVMLMLSNIDFGIILTPIAGAVLLLYGIFYNRLNKNRLLKIIKYIIAIGLCLELAFSCFLFIYGSCDNVTYDEDALIVLGAGLHGEQLSLPLLYRLDAALVYIEKNSDVTVVVSGGQGFQETVTEADAMEKYLVENGVNPGNIIKEENATSTFENYRFSKQLLDERFQGNTYAAATITNDFHIFRATLLADLNGLDVTHCHAKIPWYTTVSNYIRETAALMKLLVTGN